MKKRLTRKAAQAAESVRPRTRKDSGAAASGSAAPWANPNGPAHVFVGPSLDGADKEYVKIVSGRVTDRKPSFA
ncbi:hypothetical protein [Gorillibacterium sp. sgz500922]|uniref:hypothetical protein n=1 Tax=Gorillibacterium sp. sgz500922 TaxID=3446694 RepID=UPI003F66647C